MFEMIGNLKVVQSPYLTAAESLVLVAKRNILVKESDLEVVEGRLPGSVDNEIIGVMSYVMVGMWPESVSKITA